MKVAKSLFDLGPDDQLVTVDAYNEQVAAYEPPEAMDVDKAPEVQPEITSEEDLAKKKADKPPEKSEAPMGEGIDALGSLGDTRNSPSNDLTPEEKKEVQKAIDKRRQDGDKGYSVDSGVGASTVVTPSGDIDLEAKDGPKVKAGLKIFANLFGDSFICGIIEETGKIKEAAGALFDLSLDIDIVECLTDLINAAQSEKLRGELVKQAGKTFMNKGQVDGLSKMIDVAGPDPITSGEEDPAGKVLGNYQRPRFISDVTADGGKRPVTPNDDPALYAQLDDTLGRLGPNWDKYDRNGDPVTDAQVLRKASPEAQSVLKSNRGKRVDTAVAQAYTPGSRKARAQGRYPGAVIDATPRGYAATA